MSHPGNPAERARSAWSEGEPYERRLAGVLVVGTTYERRVGDGVLVALVAEESVGWHMSISFRDHRGRLSRYPRWDEIADARYELLPADRTFAMLLPPPAEYVALHDTTFHLHELREGPP